MSLLEALFLRIINMSITASYIIIVILLLRFCIRKLPKIFSYLLWGIAGFRLICPVSFSSIASIFNLSIFDIKDTVSDHGTLDYISNNIGYMDKPQVSVGINAANNIINHRLPAATPYASINPMQVYIFVATFIWVTGIAVLLIYSVISYIQLKYRVSNAVLLLDNIYECDNIASPFVMGFLRPKIFIPYHLVDKEQEYILRHEQYHIKRHDYLIKPFAFLILTVYWFHPLVWISYFLMSRDMEMSCDEKVLSDLGSSIKNDYSLSLLGFAVGHRFPSASPLTFGETDTKKRVRNILNFKKPSRWILAIATSLCIVAVIACCSNASAAKNFFQFKEEQMKNGAGKTVKYQYSMKNDIHSVAVYEEIYKNGVLYDTKVNMYGNVKEDEIKQKDTVSVTANPVSDQNGNFTSLNWEVAYDGGQSVVTTIPTLLPQGFYRGYTLASLGENSGKKISIKPGEDKILFAATFSNNQIKPLACEDLMAGPDYYTNILKNMSKFNACVIVHVVFSDLDADTLKDSLNSSYAMKLFKYRNQYIGNAPAYGKLLGVLGISKTMGEFTTMLKTDKEPYILRMRFKNQPEDKGEFNSQMKDYADILLALIDNAGIIEWSYPENKDGELKEQIYSWSTLDASKNLKIDDIKNYGKTVGKLQGLIDKLSKNKTQNNNRKTKINDTEL